MRGVLSASSPGATITHAYDKNGDLISKNVTTGGTVRWYYTWGVAGDLLKVATNSVSSIASFIAALAF